MTSKDPQDPQLVPFTTRLNERNRDRLKKLAAHEGEGIEAVTNRIFDLFFEGIGEIPKKKSFLETWPVPKPKSKKP